MTIEQKKELLQRIWWAGTESVKGAQAVEHSLAEKAIAKPDCIISVGKAASSMCLGALKFFGPIDDVLVVTKYDHVDEELKAFDGIEIIESAHPIPDENSLSGGAMIRDKVTSLPSDANLLLLVSGGASSLAEVLVDGMTLDQLMAFNSQMIAGDATIEEINAKRKELSLIKGGQLLKDFTGGSVTVFGISDVKGEDIAVLGSGIGSMELWGNQDVPYQHEERMVGSNTVARNAADSIARSQGLDVIENAESLYDNVEVVAKSVADLVQKGPAGIYILGGEPTVKLPENPGVGGRNQSLALLLAREFQGKDDVQFIVAGTDGTDGPTRAAGGFVDGATYGKGSGADEALVNCDAGTYLEDVGDLFVSGPTGTNVMDLMIALKS